MMLNIDEKIIHNIAAKMVREDFPNKGDNFCGTFDGDEFRERVSFYKRQIMRTLSGLVEHGATIEIKEKP